MAERLFMMRLFLGGSAVLLVLGLALWFLLPIAQPLPPYLVTAVLALGYGLYCLWRGRRADARKP